MVISISTQFGLVIYSLAAGTITGILFDSYRLIRGFNNVNKTITFVEDILFWLFAGILVFLFLLYTKHAYIGMYVYMGIAIGIYLYMKLISNFFINTQYKILRTVLKILRIVKNIIIYPFLFVIYNIKTKNKRNYKK